MNDTYKVQIDGLEVADGKVKGLGDLITVLESRGYNAKVMRTSGPYELLGKVETSWAGFDRWRENAAKLESCYPFLCWFFNDVAKIKMPDLLEDAYEKAGVTHALKEDLESIESAKKPEVKSTELSELIEKIKEMSGCTSVQLTF